MKIPERTTAQVFPRYLGGEVLPDSAIKMAGAFRAVLPLSLRGGWVSRARDSGAVDRV
jgi:hypothetical protein